MQVHCCNLRAFWSDQLSMHTTHTHIYIYAVELITWPSKVNNLAICFFFFFFIFFVVFCCFFQKSSSFCRENEIFEKKTSFNKKSVKKK